MTDTTRSLRAKLQHAQRESTKREELNIALITELNQLRDKLAEAESNRDYNHRLFESAITDKVMLSKELDETRKVSSEVRERLTSTQFTLRGVESDRDHARAQAEAMRFHAFPIPPTFEWERPQSLQELQDFDQVTRMRRR